MAALGIFAAPMARIPTLLFGAILTLVLACAGAAQGTTYDSFVQKLTAAWQATDQKTGDRLIRENPTHSLAHFENVLRVWTVKPDDGNRKILDQLKDGFRRVYETDTLEQMERYYSMRGSDGVKDLEKADKVLFDAYAQLETYKAAKDRENLAKLAEGLMALAQTYEGLGHAIKAAEVWSLRASTYYALPDATLAERKEALTSLRYFKEKREVWAWTKDTVFLNNAGFIKAEEGRVAEAEKEAEKRKAAGYGADVRGAEALVMPSAKEEIAELHFKVQAKPQVDMFARGGPQPTFWLATQVQKEGPTENPWMKAAKLYLVRPGANKFGVTLDGNTADLKKNHFVPVETAGSVAQLKPAKFFLGPDNTLPYALWFYLASDKEQVMGMQQNLAPQKDAATLYFKSAASWSCTLAGETVTFFDDNCNGKLFEEQPWDYGLRDRTLGDGLDKESAVPAFDSMQVGKGTVQPFSPYVQIAGNWYHLRGHDDGRKAGIRPLNPEYFKTGTLQLKWVGPAVAKPEVLIVMGRNEASGMVVNLADGKPAAVPAGEYEIAFGRIAEPKVGGMMAHIYKGQSSNIPVGAGKPAVLELGAPFKVDFVREGKDDEILIDSTRFKVLGKGGELYARIQGGVPAVEVVASRSKDGKGGKVIGEFIQIPDPDLLGKLASNTRFAQVGIEAGFFPIVKGTTDPTTILKVKAPFPGAVVGLQQAKNKLFGKLDPIFH